MLRLIRLNRAFCSAKITPNYKYKFNYGSSLLPHPEKAHKGG